MTTANRSILLFAAIVCLFGPKTGHAESLGDAWRAALSVNPQLRAQRLNTSAAGLNLTAAQHGYLPKGSAAAVDAQLLSPTPKFSLAPTGSSTPGAVAGAAGAIFPIFGAGQNNYPFAVTSLNQPLYAGGRIRSQVRAADAQLAEQKAGQFRTVLDLKLSVAEAYVGVLQARRNLEVAKSDVTRLQSFVNDVESRRRVGMATRNEELSADVSLANARLREIQTRNAQRIAWATYNRYLMRPLEAPVELDELGPPPSAARHDVPPDSHEQMTAAPAMQDELAVLTEQAVRSRPELAELSGRARALRAQAEVTRSSVRPNVNLGLNYVYVGFNTLANRDIWAATAVGTWSFYDGGVSRRQAQAQEQQGQAAMQQRADQAAAIALEVRTRWLNLTEARERVDVARVAVDQSDENVNVVTDRYRQQLSTYTEVLDAEAQRVQAYANFYNAVYDSALAWFRLHRAVGDL
jgi:outer membrane protein